MDASTFRRFNLPFCISVTDVIIVLCYINASHILTAAHTAFELLSSIISLIDLSTYRRIKNTITRWPETNPTQPSSSAFPTANLQSSLKRTSKSHPRNRTRCLLRYRMLHRILLTVCIPLLDILKNIIRNWEVGQLIANTIQSKPLTPMHLAMEQCSDAIS